MSRLLRTLEGRDPDLSDSDRGEERTREPEVTPGSASILPACFDRVGG